MTIGELGEDVAYHCKSVHPRDNTAQTRIAKVLPELIAVLETAIALMDDQRPFGDYALLESDLRYALADFQNKLQDIYFA